MYELEELILRLWESSLAFVDHTLHTMVSRTAITVAITNPAERRREDNVEKPARLCRFTLKS